MEEQSALMKQFISDQGVFDAAAMQDFSRSAGLHGCGLSYAVVAVIGPQSSGKSTLMNYLYGTKFRVMSEEDIGQTTQGIWIAKAEGRKPLTLVLDLEGTDSGERGEDGTRFEKQSCLFALAVADVVFINLCCKDIGRESASCRPLLISVFQAKMRLTNDNSTKTTLIYVLRDQTKSSIETLERKLRENIGEMWDKIIKPQAYKDIPLAEFFNVEVTVLPNYQEKEEEFKEQVALLGQRYFPSSGLACAGRSTGIPGSEFGSAAGNIWQRIREDRDLDLPAFRIMVATVRCDEIANEKLNDFETDQDLIDLKEEAANADLVPRFGERAEAILNTYLSKYDEESQYFDGQVRDEKRQDLKSKALQKLYLTYMNMVRKVHPVWLLHFKKALEEHLNREDGFAAAVSECTSSSIQGFDIQCSGAAIEQANWDTWDVRRTLVGDIEAHALLVRNDKLQYKLRNAKDELDHTLLREVKRVFEDGREEDPWGIIRGVMDGECSAGYGTAFRSLFGGFELDLLTAGMMEKGLREEATRLVRMLAEERAVTAVSHMLQRFCQVNPEAAVEAKDEALDECVKLLSIMAVMRVDGGGGGGDNVQRVLHSVLRYGHSDAENIWVNVPTENILINPSQCKTLWNQFMSILEHQYAEIERAAQEGGWQRWAIMVSVGAAACVVIAAVPEMTIGAVALSSFCNRMTTRAVALSSLWMLYEVGSIPWSHAFGLLKKVFSYFWRSRSTIIPVIMRMAELFYNVLEETQRRQQVGHLRMIY